MYYRKHIRLQGFNYASSLYYFVTLCTKGRKDLFVPTVCPKYGFGSNLHLHNVAAPLCGANSFLIQGNTEIVQNKINQIPKYYEAEIDFYCIMPDHIHLIIHITKSRENSLALIIKALKSWITVDIKKLAAQSAAATKIQNSVFQTNYYEHIIRSEDHLNRIRNYILQNPEIEYQDIEWEWLDGKVV